MLSSAPAGAQVFERGKNSRQEVEEALRRVKRDFTWEMLAGVSAQAVEP